MSRKEVVLKMKKISILTPILAMWVVLTVQANAETDSQTAAPSNSPSAEKASEPALQHSAQSSPQSPAKSQKRKGRAPREKEAEGTQAPNRFDSDIIIKSHYVDPNDPSGKSLEVDTD